MASSSTEDLTSTEPEVGSSNASSLSTVTDSKSPGGSANKKVKMDDSVDVPSVAVIVVEDDTTELGTLLASSPRKNVEPDLSKTFTPPPKTTLISSLDPVPTSGSVHSDDSQDLPEYPLRNITTG
jgi:hypothetical protein